MLSFHFFLATVVADSVFEPFGASGKGIQDSLDEAWVLGALLFLGSGTGKPLDGERLCSPFSLVMVVADSLFEPFGALGEVIKAFLDESSLLLPEAWVLGAISFLGPCIEQPLDGERRCSPFSIVKVVADSLFEPFFASNKVIRVLIDGNSLLSLKAWVLGAFVFVGPCTGQPLDAERLCSHFSLVTVVADSLFEIS